MTGMTGRKRPATRARAESADTAAPLRALLDSAESGGDRAWSRGPGRRTSTLTCTICGATPVLSREEEHELAAALRAHASARAGAQAHQGEPAAGRQDRLRVPPRPPQPARPGPGGQHRPHPGGAAYDPYRGVKLSTYAAWWIRAYILKFILNNWRLVKIGTTQAQRKLFFNLRKERERLSAGRRDRQPAAGRRARRQRARGGRDGAPAGGVGDVAGRARSLAVETDDGSGAPRATWCRRAASTRPDLQVESGEFQELLRVKLALFAAEPARSRARHLQSTAAGRQAR